MNQINEIIKSKINSRINRNTIINSSTIKDILNECCMDLQIDVPELVCCDTLAKSFSTFCLRNKAYLIYDNCLVEALHIFNSIVANGKSTSNVNKFFYKLFAEELACQGDFVHSIYFIGKYSELFFDFLTDDKEFEDMLSRQLTFQIYFLISHELTHLALQKVDGWAISNEFFKLIQVATRLLMERFTKDGMSQVEVLSQVSGFFLKDETQDFDEYMNLIAQSERFCHFVEECYCDFMGFKLLLEHYAAPDESIGSITNTLNFLILLECVKSDLHMGIKGINNIKKEAQDTLYFSVLRVQVLLIILQMNETQGIKTTRKGIKDCSFITERLELFIQSLPDESSLSVVEDSILKNISRDNIISYITKKLYFCRVI